MRENEEALAMQQKESLRSFAEDIYNKVGSRISSAVLTHDGLCYTIEFNTADRFSRQPPTFVFTMRHLDELGKE